MFGLLSFIRMREESEAVKKARKRQLENRIEREVQDWADDIKWQKLLVIRASTFPTRSLFKVKPTKTRMQDSLPEQERALSPNRSWAYTELILPRGEPLNCVYGSKVGEALFDDDIAIPLIHQRQSYDNQWPSKPWMSTTPQEILTLRCGTRFAKGTTVIAGLGMGHQLEQVCKRKQVKKVVVVEKEKELVDWVLPQLDLNDKDVEFVIGDAKELVPKMTADAALIDIYKGYGWNTFPDCPNIKKVWVWGSAKLPDQG